MTSHTAVLTDAARAVLAKNDRDGYSVPSGSLYPMQFNWDSAFAALGYAHCRNSSEDRPWRELELLTEAQWRDGMIPHIVFRGDYRDYFPGPDVWRAVGGDGDILPTSGITNPPIAAFAVKMLRRQLPLADKGRYRRLLARLAKWHHWLAAHCLDEEYDAFVTVHPWETGRDNLCDWDSAMARINQRDHGAYTRSDTKIIAAEQRPHQSEYDRFLEIIAVGRECGWQASVFRRASPFQMFDPGITAILAFANDCLSELLAEEGMAEQHLIADIGDRARRGLAFLWSDTVGGYTAYDPVLKQHSSGISSAAFLAPLAGLHGDVRHQRLMQEFDRIAEAVPYIMPSYDPAHAAFSPLRYWRGPVWLQMNLLIYEGLRRAGENARAARLMESSLALAAKSGFYEYYNPASGDGLGGNPFTWTAAATLYFLNQETH